MPRLLLENTVSTKLVESVARFTMIFRVRASREMTFIAQVPGQNPSPTITSRQVILRYRQAIPSDAPVYVRL